MCRQPDIFFGVAQAASILRWGEQEDEPMLTLLSLLGCAQVPAQIAHNRYEEPVTDREVHPLSARVVDARDLTIPEHAVTVTSLTPEVVEVISGGAFRCLSAGAAHLRLEGGGIEQSHTLTCRLD